MKTLKPISIIFAALLTLAGLSHAQTAPTTTTLAAAVTSTSANTVQLASGTSVATGTYLYLPPDGEVMYVTGAENGSSTIFHVVRGQFNTRSVTHSSGSLVIVAPAGGAARNILLDYTPTGSCTAANQPNLPVYNVFTAQEINCVGGEWLASRLQPFGNSGVGTQYTWFTTFAPGTAISNTAVTNTAGGIYYAAVFVPSSATITGACVLNGGTVGTDKVIYALYDGSGALVANTATAGTTSATASKYQCIAFTATAKVYGPATYYLAYQANGTTDNFQAYAANGAPTKYGTGTKTGSFGTLTSITPPTTFTADKGPVGMLY